MQPKDDKSILMNKRSHQIEEYSSDEENSSDDEENHASPMDYEKKIQQRRAESLAFLKSLKIEEAKADLKEALRAKNETSKRKPCRKIIYERVPRALRAVNRPDYTEKNLRDKLRAPHIKGKKSSQDLFEAHTKKISKLDFNPFNPTRLVSCSSDGTLRSGDIVKQVFNEEYSSDEENSSDDEENHAEYSSDEENSSDDEENHAEYGSDEENSSDDEKNHVEYGSDEENSSDDEENHASSTDYENKVQQRRAENLALLKSLKIEEAKADLKEALRAKNETSKKKPCRKIIYERAPQTLRPVNRLDYTETNLRVKLRAPHIKDNKKEPQSELRDSEFNMKHIKMSQLCEVLERSAQTGVSFDDLLPPLKKPRLPPKPVNDEKKKDSL